MDESFHHIMIKVKSLSIELFHHGMYFLMIRIVVLKSMQQDLQIHDGSLRIDIVNFNIRQ